MKSPKIPHPYEWDFRAVTTDALPTAVLYEYARESEKVRKAACQWLASKHKGKTTRKWLITALGESKPLASCRHNAAA